MTLVSVEAPAERRAVCLEFSYEVIHKVGGIETVVRTKAPAMVQHYGSDFFMVGPFVGTDDRYFSGFEDAEASSASSGATGAIGALLQGFERTYGVQGVRYGRWLIPGTPQVILLPLIYDPNTLFGQNLVRARTALREMCGLEIPDPAPGEKEPFAWNAFVYGVMSWCLLSYLRSTVFDANTDMVVHSHEWLAAIGQLLYTKCGNNITGEHENTICFLFTTHATTVGRHLSAGNICLNDCIKHGQTMSAEEAAAHWDWEATRRKVQIEHRVERAAAHTATVFTTVSDITGQEAECFLGRRPDVITYNGMDVSSAQNMNDADMQNSHYINKAKILKFLRGHFYGTELTHENTMIFFSAGRLEFQNKGYDIFLDALRRLRDRLTTDPSLDPSLKKWTVVGVIIAPSRIAHYHVDTLKGVNMMEEITSQCAGLATKVQKRMVDKIVGNKLGSKPGDVALSELVDKDDLVLLKRLQQSYNSRPGLPSIVTHMLADPARQDATEPILLRMRQLELFNQRESPVKVVWIPEFVSKTSPVGLDYSEFIYGGNLGVFCSLYEPWGYTSPECACVGTPSIVSNLCGFGSFVERCMSKDGMKRSESVVESSERVFRISSLKSLAADSPTPQISPTLPPANGGAQEASPVPVESVEQIIQEHEANVWNSNRFGVQVLDRIFKSYSESVEALSEMFLSFLKLTKYERIILRNKTSRASVICDWAVMADRYWEAHDLALSKIRRFTD